MELRRRLLRALQAIALLVAAGSPWTGRDLSGLDLRGRFGLTALAVKDAADAPFRYGPAPEETLRAGAVLVVLGEERRIGEARGQAGSGL